MPRRCTVCSSPQRDLIDQAITSGRPLRAIAGEYAVSRQSLQRHRDGGHLIEAAQGQTGRDVMTAENLVSKIQRFEITVEKLHDACVKLLEDPDRPGELTLDPNASEIRVILVENRGGVAQKRSEMLDSLIRKVEKDQDIRAIGLEYKHTDPRRFVMDALDRCHRFGELLGKIYGQLKTRIEVSTSDENFSRLVDILLETMRKYPASVRCKSCGSQVRLPSAEARITKVLSDWEEGKNEES